MFMKSMINIHVFVTGASANIGVNGEKQMNASSSSMSMTNSDVSDCESDIDIVGDAKQQLNYSYKVA